MARMLGRMRPWRPWWSPDQSPRGNQHEKRTMKLLERRQFKVRNERKNTMALYRVPVAFYVTAPGRLTAAMMVGDMLDLDLGGAAAIIDRDHITEETEEDTDDAGGNLGTPHTG